MTMLEFWPDYGGGPLWSSDGKSVDVKGLPLSDELSRSLTAWNAAYTEERIPVEGPGDLEWLKEGARLLDGVRRALGPDHQVVVTEPWWGE